MSDDRTERQRQAESALDAAIREMHDADIEANDVSDPGLLTEWMVLALVVGTNDDGSWSNNTRWLPHGGDLMPLSHSLGLLRLNLVEVEARIGRGRHES